MHRGFFFQTPTLTDNLCSSKITQNIWHPCNHSANNDTSLLCANFQQSHPPLLSPYYHLTENVSAPQCRKMSFCLCALELWDNIRFTQVLLELSSAGPALPQSSCICIKCRVSPLWGLPDPPVTFERAQFRLGVRGQRAPGSLGAKSHSWARGSPCGA